MSDIRDRLREAFLNEGDEGRERDARHMGAAEALAPDDLKRQGEIADGLALLEISLNHLLYEHDLIVYECGCGLAVAHMWKVYGGDQVRLMIDTIERRMAEEYEAHRAKELS